MGALTPCGMGGITHTHTAHRIGWVGDHVPRLRGYLGLAGASWKPWRSPSTSIFRSRAPYNTSLVLETSPVCERSTRSLARFHPLSTLRVGIGT
eukprot:1822820-Prorocentrum_lima.AAC.1